MPYFVYRCYDAPNMLVVRDSLRPAHREHLKTLDLGVTVLAGGRMMSDDGKDVIGTMIIVKAEAVEQVQQFMEADPYAQGGIFERCEIERWDWGLGLPASEVES